MTEDARIAKEYLSEIYAINLEIERKRADREYIFNLSQQCGAIITGNRVQISRRCDKMDNYVIQLIEIEKQSGELIEMWLAQRDEIIDKIDDLHDPRYRNVLHYRYVLGYKLEDVAEAMHYSIEMVKVLHRKALDELGRNLKEGGEIRDE